jgi:hypothetical protein
MLQYNRVILGRLAIIPITDSVLLRPAVKKPSQNRMHLDLETANLRRHTLFGAGWRNCLAIAEMAGLSTICPSRPVQLTIPMGAIAATTGC